MKRLINFLIARLGFVEAGCGIIPSDPFDDPVAEYGAPHVTFRVSARVIDEAGTPIKGIQLVVGDGEAAEYNSSFSDEEGIVDMETWMWPGGPYNVVFVDVDGKDNGGEFETLKLDITDKVTQYEDGSGSWYQGGYEAELGDVTLQKADEEID